MAAPESHKSEEQISEIQTVIARVRIHLLGEFRVEINGNVIPASAWRLSKARNLIQMLALAPGHTLHREQVMDALWPDADSRSAAGNYRQVVHAARRALQHGDEPFGGAQLYLRGGRIQLAADNALWIDVEEFDKSTSKARQANDPALLEAALDLYAGDLLPADPYSDWSTQRRTQLRENAVALLIELATLRETRGEYEQAIEAYQRVLEIDVSREHAHASLMRLFVLRGDPTRSKRQYQILCEVLSEHLDAEPSQLTQQLHDDIVAGRLRQLPDQPDTPPRILLPAPLTRFIGRGQELETVSALVDRHRLVTLTGVGGSGKTRLALAAGEHLRSKFSDRITFVDLAAITRPQLVVRAVLAALGIREVSYHSANDTLIASLQDVPTLLILDNCEHLTGVCGELAGQLLSNCPDLRILVTSRERLHLDGEVTWRVPALSLPEPSGPLTRERVLQSEAVQLFVDRATLRQPDFDLTDGDLEPVAEICRRLDGLPLAIELAAARMDLLTPNELVARLHDALGLLSTDSRSISARHQTLRATLDWSYGMLAGSEQAALRSLSVFFGGWSLDAAQTVLAVEKTKPTGVLELLAGLHDRSLVQTEQTENGMRYSLLETVRQYGMERLHHCDGERAARQRHADYFVGLADACEPELRDKNQAIWLARLDLEVDNIRAALEWCSSTQQTGAGLRLCWGMWRFWNARGYLDEGRKWMTSFLSLPFESNEEPVRVGVLFAASRFAMLQSDDATARELANACREAAMRIGDPVNLSGALTLLGHISLRHGELEEARRAYEDGLAVRRNLADDWGIGISLVSLAGVEHVAGEFERARDLYHEARSLFLATGDAGYAAFALYGLGNVALDAGQLSQAERLLEEALAELQVIGDRPHVVECLNHLARLAIERDDLAYAGELLTKALQSARELQAINDVVLGLEGFSLLAAIEGKPARALSLAAAAERLRLEHGESPLGKEREHLASELERVRHQLDSSEEATAVTYGRLLSLGRAVELALSLEPD